MQLIFYLVAIIGSAYFLLHVRRFDFFSMAFAASLLYFLPGFFGFVRSSRDFAVAEAILPETYAVFILVLGGILIGGWIYDRLLDERRPGRRNYIPLTLTSEFSLGIAVFGLLITLVVYGDVLFLAQKSEILEGLGRWHLLYRFGAIFAVVFAVLRRQTALAFIAFSLLLFDLYIGFRFGITIALLASAVVVLNRRGPQSLLRNERVNLVLGIVAVSFVLVYKQIYTLVKYGLWDILANRLTDPQIIEAALVNSEPFTTQSILNTIIMTDFETGAAHLTSLGNLLVPLATMLGAESVSFNDLFQPALFAGTVTGGMANNIWAEMFAVGGWMALLIAVSVFAALLALGSWLLATSRGAGTCLVAIAFTIIAFYIHRNDLGFELTLIRRCFFIWVVMIVPAMAMQDIRSSRRHA